MLRARAARLPLAVEGSEDVRREFEYLRELRVEARVFYGDRTISLSACAAIPQRADAQA